MALRTLTLDVSLDALLHENAFTTGRLQSHPLAVSLTPPFDAFQVTWAQINSARIALVIAAGKAEGEVAGADDALDDFIDTLDRTLLIACKNDRKDVLYQHYFGLRAPSVLKRPILGPELATVRKWTPSLAASADAAIAALAPTLQTLVAGADSAVTAKAAADQAVKDFDNVGPKKALVSSYNALRKDSYGKLAQLPHTKPAAMLPPTFADRFFLHDKMRAPAAAKHDPVEIQAKIDAHQKAIDSLKADLAAAQVVAANHKAERDAAQKLKDELAQAKKDDQASRKKVKDLKAKEKAAAKKAKKPKRSKH